MAALNKILFLLICLFFVKSNLIGQEKFKLKVADVEISELVTTIEVKKGQNIFNLITDQFYHLGYLSCSIDSINEERKIVFVTAGQKYNWNRMTFSKNDEALFSKLNFNQKKWTNHSLSLQQLNNLKFSTITYLENIGYPFASFNFDNILFSDSTASAKIKIAYGPKITIDSLIISSETEIAHHYISNYIEIKKGADYNENIIRNLSTRLKEISFITEVSKPKIYFSNQGAQINLVVKKRKASTANGIIGLTQDENTGELLVTGDAKINLINAFNKGESLKLQWRKLQNNSQEVYSTINTPYIFNTPFGIAANINLFRSDTTFAQQSISGSVLYGLSRGNFFNLSFYYDASQIITTTNYLDAITLPPFADVTTRGIGIGLKNNKLNYKFNPRSGYAITFNLKAGNKKIIKNPVFNESAYEGLALNNNSYSVLFDGSWYIPIMKRSTIKLSNSTGTLINNNLFYNELFRIGGFQLMRGIDESSIFASTYSIQTLEYRILLEENSYFYFFTDLGFWEQNLNTGYLNDIPFSFGSGISFETKPGIFSINYALGKQFNNPIQLNAAKVHFGFVSLF